MTRIRLMAVARLLSARVAALVVAASLLAGPPGLAASAQAGTVGATLTGGSMWGSAQNYTVGWEFTTDNDISITSLGVVDADGGGLGQTHTVRLYDKTNDTILATTTIPAGTPATVTGGYNSHFVALGTPIDLTTGVNYIVAKQNGADNYRYNAALTMGPGINWIEGPARGGGLPSSVSGFTIHHGNGSYFGPNFMYESVGGALTLSQPTGRTVLQRDDANTAEVTVAGTYSGSVSRIEARAVPRAGFSGTPTGWQVIDNAPSGGAFAGSLTDVPGGWYDVEVKTFDGLTELAAATTERVGVGEVFVMAGQSNSANYGSPQQSADDDRVSMAMDYAVTAWQHADDPQPLATGGGGAPWPELGDLVAAEHDVPVGVVSVGVGGTRVDQWLPGGLYDSRIKPVIEALGADGFRAVLWHQGESDSLAGTPAGTYAARLESIIAQSRIDAGFDVPWGVALASYHPGSSSANEARVIAGQQQVIAGDPLVFEGAFTDDFHVNGWLSDSVHFNQTGLDEHALRWSQQIRSSGIMAPIPEPATLVMLGLTVAGLGRYVRRRRARDLGAAR